MAPFIHNTQYAQMLKKVADMDKDLGVLVQAIATHKAKHTFLMSMCQDPVNFTKNWLSSQKRDLEVMMGESTRSGNVSGDEWRRGGKESIWNTPNARESVNVLLSKHPIHR